MTIFARPSEWASAQKDPASARPSTGGTQHYFAFLSYSHRDEEDAEWLHDALESYRVPSHLVGRLTEHGSVPRRLTPIFRDLSELPASDDLGEEICEAIAASRFLIVLCSPAAAVSRWTNAEIETFKAKHPDGTIFAAIVAGEPFACEIPDREAQECLPKALRFKYDRHGRPTTKKIEPLAADFRGDSEARRRGFLKLVAGMLGVGLDDLVRRDEVRRQKRLAVLAAASLAGMVVTSALAVAAIQARDAARDQRREAEGLIGFMLGDLRSKLEPVGRLDALDGVGSKVLAYYQKQEMSDLPDAALLQRSRALALMGEIANARGNSDGALRQFQAALAGTAEALRRNPNDPQRLFDHAQIVYNIGELARQRGQSDKALAAMREYKSLANRMVALEPDNLRWRVETQYADANLGIVLFGQRQFEEAARAFEQALKTIQGLATADPNNADYQKGAVETLAWLADARMAEGRIPHAIALRQRQKALLEQLISRSGGDVEFREDLIHSLRALGHAYGASGETEAAVQNMRLAVQEAQKLADVEPANRSWAGNVAQSHLDLARILIFSGNIAAADGAARAGCSINQTLLARDKTVADWRAAERDCLSSRSQIALATGNHQAALHYAQQAFDVGRSLNSGDAIGHRYALAATQRLIGDARLRSGDREGARKSWQAALDALPPGAAEKPMEMSEHVLLLQRLGRNGEARPLEGRLKSMRFHQST
jgi:tetratricopeptide (TPR) repeat protein